MVIQGAVPGHKQPVALVCVAEKGNCTVELTVNMKVLVFLAEIGLKALLLCGCFLLNSFVLCWYFSLQSFLLYKCVLLHRSY